MKRKNLILIMRAIIIILVMCGCTNEEKQQENVELTESQNTSVQTEPMSAVTHIASQDGTIDTENSSYTVMPPAPETFTQLEETEILPEETVPQIQNEGAALLPTTTPQFPNEEPSLPENMTEKG